MTLVTYKELWWLAETMYKIITVHLRTCEPVCSSDAFMVIYCTSHSVFECVYNVSTSKGIIHQPKRNRLTEP